MADGKPAVRDKNFGKDDVIPMFPCVNVLQLGIGECFSAEVCACEAGEDLDVGCCAADAEGLRRKVEVEGAGQRGELIGHVNISVICHGFLEFERTHDRHVVPSLGESQHQRLQTKIIPRFSFRNKKQTVISTMSHMSEKE